MFRFTFSPGSCLFLFLPVAIFFVLECHRSYSKNATTESKLLAPLKLDPVIQAAELERAAGNPLVEDKGDSRPSPIILTTSIFDPPPLPKVNRSRSKPTVAPTNASEGLSSIDLNSPPDELPAPKKRRRIISDFQPLFERLDKHKTSPKESTMAEFPLSLDSSADLSQPMDQENRDPLKSDKRVNPRSFPDFGTFPNSLRPSERDTDSGSSVSPQEQTELSDSDVPLIKGREPDRSSEIPLRLIPLPATASPKHLAKVDSPAKTDRPNPEHLKPNQIGPIVQLPPVEEEPKRPSPQTRTPIRGQRRPSRNRAEERPSRSIGPVASTRRESPHNASVAKPAKRVASGEDPLDSISRRADLHTRNGFALASRGAIFSAQAEFVKTLRLLSQALDTRLRTRIHSRSLAAGLKAIEEADDFVADSATLEDDMDIALIIASHRTPVLKNADLRKITLLEMLQRYYTFAQNRLAESVAGQPAGSMALYGLGRLHISLDRSEDAGAVSRNPKSILMHQAAIMVDSRNYMAANELGVLLGRCGQHKAAIAVLRQSVAVEPSPVAWRNLAKIHQRLGEDNLAQGALAQANYADNRLRQYPAMRPRGGPQNPVVWVSPEHFSKRLASTGSPTTRNHNAGHSHPINSQNNNSKGAGASRRDHRRTIPAVIRRR